MKTGKLLIKNFGAQISKIEIIPRSADSEITIHSKMYDEPGGGKIPVKILFNRAAAISSAGRKSSSWKAITPTTPTARRIC